MTHPELGCCIGIAVLAVTSTSAAAAPKKPARHGAAPAASSSTPPAASAPPPPPAASDEESAPAAPSSEDRKITAGADLLFVLPVGNLSDVSGPQIGPLLRGGYRVMPQLEATARIGYLFAFGKSQSLGGSNSASTSVTDIPIWLGARYFLQDWPAGPYAAAEIGVNFLTANASGTVNGQSVSQSNGDTRAGFDLGVGYVVSKELPIDVRLQYSYFNLIGAGGEGALMGLGLSGGYSLFF